ncbi:MULTISPECIES: hypothetical protein [unclassified Pseudonocardia]|uniref:hypothetical protein n=1 Tax=unclassified Pseudonocardia TaxID=2619320 RepID=UPI001D048CC3|nr:MULTISPECIES: hypothetical protein [unclassified Pseudonocardia]
MSHPLSRLIAAEINTARTLLAEHDLLSPGLHVPVLAVEEPTRAKVAVHRDGAPVDRRVRAVPLDPADGTSRTVIASLTRSSGVAADLVVKADEG